MDHVVESKKRRYWRRALSVGVALSTAACAPGVLDPRGPVGIAERTLLIDSLAIMLVIVVPVIVATIGVAWWFRAGNARARYRPDWSFSGLIELVVWSIPLMTIVLLGGVTWIASHALDPAATLEPAGRQPTLEIQVVSLDWKWLFIYPGQGVASVNRLVVPAGTNLTFSLTSSSVMNTFFVPQLGSMIYTMYGMTTRLNLRADRPGIFRGQSGHFSGDGFSDMQFQVHAVPQAEFQRWIAGAKAERARLDSAAYSELAKQSSDVAAFSFGTVETGLFESVVLQRLPPGSGPSIAARNQARSSSSGR